MNEQRRAEGLPIQSAAGTLPEERREQFEDIDPAWCPAWPVDWQRCFHLTRQHLDTGGTLPMTPGDVVHQGEDLGRWVRAQRLGWEKLTTVQQWMLEHILGIQPASDDEKPAAFNDAAKDPFGNERVGFESKAEIKRSEWGLTWNAILETGGVLVSDKIKLNFGISAIKNA
ncbi:YceI family protein [Streptomyces sp. NPDC007905]|uniref:YceI family protein n=1 Tax=Streptomyces sp. NPDC007905 TaxID=3364788 RepID=UPI0036E7221F